MSTGQGTIRQAWQQLASALDSRVAESLRPFTLPTLRVLLGLLFVWFGALKVMGASPVGTIVSGTLPWADPRMIVMVLGGVEVVLGIGLVTGFAVRLVLPRHRQHPTDDARASA